MSFLKHFIRRENQNENQRNYLANPYEVNTCLDHTYEMLFSKGDFKRLNNKQNKN